MPREDRLFGDVVEPSITMGDRQGASVAATIVLEAILVGVFITIPLLATDVLPGAPDMMGAFITAEPPPAAPPPPPPRAASSRNVTSEFVEPTIDAAPVTAPDVIAPEQPTFGDNRFEQHEGTGVSNVGVPGGTGIADGLPDAPPLPRVVVAPPVKETPRVGGLIQAPRKTKDVRPVYPQIAQAGRVQGLVILEATIDTRGKVINVGVVQSRALLDQAAIDAVRLWEFTPTLLNGEPTAIIMNVTVNFQLN